MASGASVVSSGGEGRLEGGRDDGVEEALEEAPPMGAHLDGALLDRSNERRCRTGAERLLERGSVRRNRAPLARHLVRDLDVELDAVGVRVPERLVRICRRAREQ